MTLEGMVIKDNSYLKSNVDYLRSYRMLCLLNDLRIFHQRVVDFRIELEPGTKSITHATYRMSLSEFAEIQKHLDKFFECGPIHKSKASYGAPVLFQKKPDGSLQLCIAYRALKQCDSEEYVFSPSNPGLIISA